MNKQIIKKWIHTFITLLLFNIVVFISVNVNTHLAPNVVYWTTGALTSGVIMNMIFEFNLLKVKENKK